MIKRINQILTIIMCSAIGVFIGHGAYKCWHYGKYPELYVMQSAPWYTGILLNGVFVLIVLTVCLILKTILKAIEKKKEVRIFHSSLNAPRDP